MSKLGIKVLLSYIIIVIISTYVFIVKIDDSLLAILTEENKDEIELAIKRLDRLFVNSLDNYENLEKPETYPENLFHLEDYIGIVYGNKLFSTNIKDIDLAASDEMTIVILDKDMNFIYSNNPDMNYYGNNISNDTSVFSERNPILLDEEIVGYYFVKRPDNVFLSGRESLFEAFYKAFFITMLIALLIALVFENSIVGPVNKLKKNIQNFSLDKKMNWEEINTYDELTDVNNEFLIMGKKLKELNIKQKSFFQNTSHELKTPLMSIQGYAEAIRDGVMDDSSKGLDIIIDECKNLRDTINSIIYISDILEEEVADTSKFEKFYIFDLIEKIKNKVEYISIDDNKINIYNLADKSIRITIDKEKLERVISNLVSNAIRYAKSKVIVESYIDINTLIIRVSDDGRGFQNGEENKIFERFYKGKGGKSGLGLSIVKSIIDSFNGEIIAYNSTKFSGAVIEIRLKSYMYNVMRMVQEEE